MNLHPARIQTLLDVEVALAESLSDAGMIPATCLPAIRGAAKAGLYDPDLLAGQAAEAGNVVIPLVAQLTARVAESDADASRYVHWGATSQDILDTALVLELGRDVSVILRELDRLVAAAAGNARRFAGTVQAGRTWLQQSTPVTFGLKAAGWAGMVWRVRHELHAALEASRVLQLGGASGTLAALGNRGLVVAELLGKRLALQVPDKPWHAERDRLVRVACALGMVTAALGKIGRDLALLAQTEVGEVHEPVAEGRGVSSAMPHKRNPVAAAVAIAASIRAPGMVATMLSAMPQEHERGLGGWQAEWDTLPQLIALANEAVRAMADAMEGLVVEAERMAANLGITTGLGNAEAVAMALAKHLGLRGARSRVAAACAIAIEENRALDEVLKSDPAVTAHLGPAELDQLLLPENYLGVTGILIERVLATLAPGKRA